MRKAKLVFWFLFVGLAALFLFQNQDYFLAKNSFHYDLYFAEYQTPAFPNGSMVIATFLIGFLMAYALSLSGRFKSKKTIKQLNETISAQRETISSLQSERREKTVEMAKEEAHPAPASGEQTGNPGAPPPSE